MVNLVQARTVVVASVEAWRLDAIWQYVLTITRLILVDRLAPLLPSPGSQFDR